mmetsp:Transcript_39841/g.106345  ORF Transcript_39841/g.106345 Transcript_39841/m.106345 type:complete len:146 (+) Transcript_39841:46-483(+)
MEARPTSMPSKQGTTNLTDHTLCVFPQAPHTASCSRWSNSKSWSMGSKLRSNDTGRMRTPGPGAYSPGQYTLPAAPRYSLSPRRDQLNNMKFVPGPGAYDPKNPAHLSRNVALGVKLSYGSPYALNKESPGAFTDATFYSIYLTC